MTLNCHGALLDLSRPLVMGILNVTPDSFFDGGKYNGEDAVLQQASILLQEGASILDVGGASSRPGAAAATGGRSVGVEQRGSRRLAAGGGNSTTAAASLGSTAIVMVHCAV